MEFSGNNMVMVRGDDESFLVSARIKATGVQEPFVTGDVVYFTVINSSPDETQVIQKVVTTFTNGKAIIMINEADTKTLAGKHFLYDVQVNKVGLGKKTIVRRAVFELVGEVTDD